MSNSTLPSADEARRSLRAHGDQFASAPRAPQPLGVTFAHPKKGEQGIAADADVLASVRRLYTNHKALLAALTANDEVNATHYGGALRLVRNRLVSPRTVWGVSGYATAGPAYEVESDGLERLFAFFESGQTPGFIVDGGVGEGVLGISGVLASLHNITSVGVIPLEGLAYLAPRNHAIVYGKTYQEREVLVGTLPDVLVCVGGSRKGTRRECMQALTMGSVVLLLAFRDDGPESLVGSWRDDPALLSAVTRGQMIVCDTPSAVPGKAGQAKTLARKVVMDNRSHRLRLLAELLASAQ